MSNKNINAKGRRKKGKFFMIPERVFKHKDFISLSSRALKLLIDIGCQYNGYNNGDLCGASKLMKKRRWTSNDQLDKAKKELVEKGFLLITRQGGRKRPTLFALTWLPIDECKGKLDINSTKKPWRDFTFEN
jgi:hypothetical protein